MATAERFVENYSANRLVIKVDGLCAGKGVSVCERKSDAINVLRDLFQNNGFARLGATKRALIIEEHLQGSEVSVFGLAHGDNVQLFCPMQDYKRLFDGDEGPNTGGMGSVGPIGAHALEREMFLSQVRNQFFCRRCEQCNNGGKHFQGFFMLDSCL